MADSACRRAISAAMTSGLAVAVSGVSHMVQVSHECTGYDRTTRGDNRGERLRAAATRAHFLSAVSFGICFRHSLLALSLIPADQHFAVIAAILFLSAISFASERTVVGQKITGTVVVILLAIVAANLGVIPHSAPAYGFIFSYIVPMLIPLFLFQADIRRLAREASHRRGKRSCRTDPDQRRI